MNITVDRLIAEEQMLDLRLRGAENSEENFKNAMDSLQSRMGDHFIMDASEKVEEPQLDKKGLDELRMLM